MARGDWNTSTLPHLSKRDKDLIGFEWRYANTEEEARRDNKDIIHILPFIMSTGGSGYCNNTKSSYYNFSYGNYSSGNRTFNTRYYYSDSDGNNKISSNVRYYLTDEDQTGRSDSKKFTATKAWPFVTNSAYIVEGFVQISMYTGFQIEIPHKEDGTADPVTINVCIKGATEHGNATATTTFTPDVIQRGTKVYYKQSSWNKVGTIHTQGEYSGQQHYLYKKGPSGWEKIYG